MADRANGLSATNSSSNVVTLEDIRNQLGDDIDGMIVDEFRKSSYLLNNLQFHKCVTPQGGGSTFTYGYYRMKSLPTAEFRAINEDYTESKATREKVTVDLKMFGGAFKIDRVLNDAGGLFDEVSFQLEQIVKATKALAHYNIIYGDSATDAKCFDGLDVALKGSSTDVTCKQSIKDLGTDNSVAIKFVDEMDEWLANLDNPSALLMNSEMLAKFRAVARRMGLYQMTQNNFGQKIDTFMGIPLIDLGEKPGATVPSINSTNQVIPTTDGKTDIYAVKFGMDAFHGITMANKNVIQTWLPDFSKEGAVKRGEVEMMMGLCLKNTRAAGVLKDIQIG